MALAHRARSDRVLIGRLPHGGDLLGELLDLCSREGVTLGRLEGLGSVRRARLACYNQEAKEYRHYVFNRPLEIAAFTGNVSLRDGAPFVHAHLVLSDETGAAFGGHLAPGTEVFAFEFLVEVLEGPSLQRSHDGLTGLALWPGGEGAK